MYVSMKEMLKKANRENYAVLAINCFNLETAQATIQAAEEMHAPIIIDLLQDHLKEHLSYLYLTKPIIRMATAAKVPVALNLDHGQDVAFVKQCLHEGFSSVMMDASRYALHKNIEITKMYTDPKEAIHFINETGVDCLAISYGSSHGEYPKDYQPKFQFDIISKIKEATHLPLVLHGGSGAGEAVILRSVKLGINKINVGSDFMKAQKNSLFQLLKENQKIEYPDLLRQASLAGKEVVKVYIELSGSKNKA